MISARDIRLWFAGRMPLSWGLAVGLTLAGALALILRSPIWIEQIAGVEAGAEKAEPFITWPVLVALTAWASGGLRRIALRRPGAAFAAGLAAGVVLVVAGLGCIICSLRTSLAPGCIPGGALVAWGATLSVRAWHARRHRPAASTPAGQPHSITGHEEPVRPFATPAPPLAGDPEPERELPEQERQVTLTDAEMAGIAPAEPLDALLGELDALPGLATVKAQVRTLVARLEHEQARMHSGAERGSMNLHCVFLGPPGTGKTTVARLLARIFRTLGLLESGHLVETSRSSLISQHVGETALKTDAVIDSALGGVLFIDEAYSLMPTGHGHDYAAEAVAQLVKRLEDDRDRFACIVAGYPEDMGRWLSSNQGLRSRFTRYLEFQAYDPQTLWFILGTLLGRDGYRLDERAQRGLWPYVQALHAQRGADWGNAREMRNLAECLVDAQALALFGQNVTLEQRLLIGEHVARAACAEFNARRQLRG